jgi:hypothetical protein
LGRPFVPLHFPKVSLFGSVPYLESHAPRGDALAIADQRPDAATVIVCPGLCERL